MKIHLKFDHKNENVLEAIDCPITLSELNDQVNDLAEEFCTDERFDTQSQLAEMIHERLDYSAILFLATESLKGKLIRAEAKSFLNRLFNDDDDE